LYLRLVDENGANLIKNITIEPENIRVEGNFINSGFRPIPSNKFAEPDADIRKYDDSLFLFIVDELKFEHAINLNNTISMVLEFDARFAEFPCGVSYFISTKLNFNNQNTALDNEESELKLLTEIEI
jgi:hypothetical protein